VGVHADVMTFNMNEKWKPLWRREIQNIDGVTVFRMPALNCVPITHSGRWTFRVNLIPGRFTDLLKKYDIIHFHDDSDLSFPLFSYFVRKPKILHLHSFFVDYYKKYFLSRYIFKNVADVYIAFTKSMENQLTHLGITKDKIRVLPNFVEIKDFHSAEKKIDNLLLFVGRVTEWKGLHVLLKSLSYLEKPVQLAIIGPPDWDVDYFEKVTMMITQENERGLHKITYLGATNHDEVMEWCEKASIFVCPSFYEIFPVSVLEALSCETPVVGSNVGGIPEIIENYKNGILVPPGSALKLAEAMQYLLENENVRKKFGEEGKQRIAKNFSSEIVVKKICKLYDEMVES
jgi:rhamnosyl/mannosyltransferase